MGTDRGAKGRELVASISHRAPAVAAVEGQAVAAVVIGGTARRHQHASEGGLAPSVAGSADALAGLTVVVVGAVRGDVVARVSEGAPGGVGLEGIAGSAVVVGGAA